MNPTIVSSEWLLDHIQRSTVKLFDCTIYPHLSPEEAGRKFEEAHLPTATQMVFRFDSRTGLDPFTTIPKPSHFTKDVTHAGLSRGMHCILYDTDGKSSYRVWWLLSFFSHPRVSIYAGGLREWVSREFPIESSVVHPVIPAPRTAFCASRREEMLASPAAIQRYVVQSIVDRDVLRDTAYAGLMELIDEADGMLEAKQIISRLRVGETINPNEGIVRQLVDVRPMPKKRPVVTNTEEEEEEEEEDEESTSTSAVERTTGPMAIKSTSIPLQNASTEEVRWETIPCSLSLPYTEFLDKNGTIIAQSSILRSIFRAAHIDVTKAITFYGDDGYQTSLAVLAASLASGLSPSTYNIVREPISHFAPQFARSPEVKKPSSI
ncbi:3-mercaptopyruvate sulfurtransferase/Thiosulfate sulfurtransferase [Giardia muris]|uniref:3-mercaptopyruvate sulfurtransferase/Thiosulfate sulfurtransferase n=1 Tax=Giardia muris TaxID=5742 RepID=A0A4Z1T7V9_GIAMU|nr:3-mercaptopyruvate sulfurtransferase/Thiosulfate sulfurtransferase [Giardia muris]|eukprot:TNJ30183.1 3-mercaptopyruvate sulfurtransferase/Thiosulfate sulfurtransferase [Giardia muris]